MKKFITALIILIILGGLAFFFGWTQLTVPPGAVGVLRSKTHGIDPRLVREGEFRWVWYKLIPANVTIAVYRLDRVEHPFTVKNALPSGGAYAAFAGITADFSYEVSANLSFSVNPDFLVSLITDNNIGSQDDLDAFETTVAGNIEAFILRRIGLGEETTEDFETLFRTGSSPELETAVKENFPYIENINCLIRTATFPDFTLYRQVRGIYEDFLARQQEYLSGGLMEKAEARIDSQLRFDELARYGELLTKYPILVQYLAIENGSLKPPEPPASQE
ncbi:MAG: hypothetical protein LBE14_04100 [Treponema sp.]|jgi:hypothetical protein|nr:hypothetical protein [Treponema sp.]